MLRVQGHARQADGQRKWILGPSQAHGPTCLVPVSFDVTSFAAGKFLAEPQTSCNHTSHALSTAVHLFLALPQARNRKAPRGENAYSRSHSVSPALGFIALVPWSWMLLLLLVSCVSVSLSTPSLQSVGPRGNFQATYPFHPCHPSHCVSSGIVCAISCRTLDRIGTLAMTPRPPLTKVCPLDQRQDTPGNHTQQSHALV